MWRSDELKPKLGESSRAFGKKLSRVAAEMLNPPDVQEMIHGNLFL
jgi:hypothetical protein